MKRCEKCGNKIMTDRLCRRCFEKATEKDADREMLGDDADLLEGMDFGDK